MKKVLFLTNYPSPYRVEFFNQLGRAGVDLTVVFLYKPESQKHRAKDWFNTEFSDFKAFFCTKYIKVFGKNFCPEAIDFIKKPFDYIVFGGYSDFTYSAAMHLLKIRGVPFYLEIDGGMIKNDSRLTFALKKHLISLASKYFSTGKVPDDYLVHYGAKREKIVRYPFSSMTQADVNRALELYKRKAELKKKLNLSDRTSLLFVGQFIHRKGIDIFLEAIKQLPRDIKIILIGAIPDEAMLNYCKENNIDNIEFPGFKKKDELCEYYAACDIMVLPTREDIWGLVVNEAMAHGMPVITTDRCVAGMELIKNGEEGYIVKAGDSAQLAQAILKSLGSHAEMGKNALAAIGKYTIENMVSVHIKEFTGGKSE